jgi:hypothetical protein
VDACSEVVGDRRGAGAGVVAVSRELASQPDDRLDDLDGGFVCA